MNEVLNEVRRLVAREDDARTAARARAGGQGSIPAPEAGALLAWAAATADARHVVEIGCACGMSGLWLLDGMARRGVLTSVEIDPHVHALATQAYEESGVSDRVRSILGDPATVLERLSDDGYDLVLLQGRAIDYPEYLTEALRLLRPGGVLVARDVLRTSGDDSADALAAFTEQLGERADLTATILPVDGGIALATLRADES